MQLEQRIVDNVAIIKVTGDITLSKGGDVLLKDKVQSLLHQGYTNLLIDLSGVSYVDSAGLGELVQTYVTAKNRGGRLRLLNPTKRLKDLLVVTKLLTVFESYDNEAAAVASFQPPRPDPTMNARYRDRRRRRVIRFSPPSSFANFDVDLCSGAGPKRNRLIASLPHNRPTVTSSSRSARAISGIHELATTSWSWS